MSSLTTLARPYAKAAFEVANGQQQPGRVASGAGHRCTGRGRRSSGGVAGQPGAWTCNRSCSLISDASSGELDEHFERVSWRCWPKTTAWRCCRRSSELFGELRAEAENRLEVRVVSAFPLADDQAERMKAALAKRFERSH